MTCARSARLLSILQSQYKRSRDCNTWPKLDNFCRENACRKTLAKRTDQTEFSVKINEVMITSTSDFSASDFFLNCVEILWRKRWWLPTSWCNLMIPSKIVFSWLCTSIVRPIAMLFWTWPWFSVFVSPWIFLNKYNSEIV